MKYSLLIVNYQTKDDVLKLLCDIEQIFLNLSYEVIIVDNHSGDQFSDDLFKTKVIYNSENAGFGKAMNVAAEHSAGDYLVLINPDCRIPLGQNFDQFVEEGVRYGFGVLAPLIRYPGGRIQPNRGGSSNLLTFVFQALRLGRLREYLPAWIGNLPLIRKSIIGKYLHNFEEMIPTMEYCDWLSGAFMVIPSRMFKEVGGFDENFFMYCEDEDICMRLKEIGGRSLFISKFTVIHEVGGAQKTGEYRRLKFTEIKRLESNIYFIQKHYSIFAAFSLRFFYFLLYLILSPRKSVKFLLG